MKISVEALRNREVEQLELDQQVRVSGELASRYPAGAHVTAAIRRISRGVYMEGLVVGEERQTCVRCLEHFTRTARVRIEEAFSEDVRPEEALISDVSPLVDGRIDLSDLVGQLLEVDEPMAAICKEDCLGICHICGTNKNNSRCACAPVVVDERLAGLARLIEEREPD